MSSKMLTGLNGLTSTITSSLPLIKSKKKFCFDVIFTLQEIVGCTYVTGVLFAKIQLKDGGTFNGTSHRNDVENHRVQWDQDFNFSCKMYANVSTGTLEPCWCKVSIRKETKGGRSCTKLGYAKINLAEYAGANERQRKYLLESYNENKHKPDNSVLKVKVDLRQTSGDIVFKVPEGKTWEFGEEDEGFEDNLSMYSRGSLATPRASTGSTMSSLSLGMSSHSSSAANLKQDLVAEGPVKEEEEEGEGDRESGSEETVVERTSSHTTVDTNTTVSGGASNKSIINNITRPSSKTPPLLQGASSSSGTQLNPDRSRTGSEQLSRKPSLERLHIMSNEQRSNSITLETTLELPLSDVTHTSSFKDIRHSKYLKKNSDLLAPPTHVTSLSRRPKASPSIQGSHVTAQPSPSHHYHKRQASAGGYTPPIVGGHKRHSSISTVSTFGEHDTSSLISSKTRATTLSTLEQSRPDSESVINQLMASCDLTPASDEEEDSNLKLFVDKRSGDVQLKGHGMMDRSRYKEVDVKEDMSTKPKAPHRKKHRVATDLTTSHSFSLHPQSSFESSTSNSS